MPLTDLFISYGAALAPAGFHKITLSDGGQAELNRGIGTSPSFLWYHESPTRGQPIVELKIMDSEDNCPEGFEKIPRNMLVGSDKFAFLFVRRCCEVDPIGQIRVLYGSESQSDVGFTRLLPPVYVAEDSGKSISLSFSTVSKDAPAKWSAATLAPGDKCDVQDSEKQWHLGEVMSSGTTKESVRVAIVMTKVPRNLTLPRSSPRLSPPHTKSSGTRIGNAEQGTACVDMTKEFLEGLRQKMQRLLPVVSRDLAGTESVSWVDAGDSESVWREVMGAVETALTSSHPPPLVPAVNSFLRAVLTLLARLGQEGQGLAEDQLHLLEKLLFLDEKFSWFYMHYGVGVITDDAFLDLHRDYMLSGPVLVTDMTKTSSSGGKSAWGSFTSTISSHFKATSTSTSLSTASSSINNDRNINLQCLKLLVTNANHFAAAGGFNVLLDSMSHSSISHVQQILSIMKVLSMKLFGKPYLEYILPKVQESISHRLLSLDDQDYRETLTKDPAKDFVVIIWLDLENMIRRVFKEIIFFEMYERFMLNYSKKLISCQMLNLKIKGLNILNDVIDKTVRKETTVKKPLYSISQSVTPANEPSWLTTAFLEEWLQQHNMLGLLLGEATSSPRKNSLSQTHDEVLKRANTVLIFLAKRQQLCSDAHVSLLWRQAGGEDVPDSTVALATSRIAYSLLAALVPYMSFSMVTKITSDISLAQLSSSSSSSSHAAEYCQLNISLVKGILEHGLSSKRPRSASIPDAASNTGPDSSSTDCEESKAENTTTVEEGVEMGGVDILWKFLIVNRSDDEASSPVGEGGVACTKPLFTSTQLAAADALATVLTKPQTRSELNSFLKKCVHHIDQFPSPPTSSSEPLASSVPVQEDISMGSILLLKRLIEMQAPSRPTPPPSYISHYHPPGATQKKAQGQELSRALIIKSCENNYELLRVMIEYIGKCIHRKSASCLSSSEYKVYTQSLQVCLELLQVVLNNSELELTVPQVTGLWEGFSSGTLQDMDMFFEWLRASCPEEAAGSATAIGYTATRAPPVAPPITTSTSKKDTSCCMTEEALVHVFVDLIGEHPDISSLSEIGFEAIEKLFRYINGKERTLLYSSHKTNFQVAAPVLVGFDVLIKVYITAKDMKIVDLMSKFLISLQVKLSPTLDKRAVWISFTTKCLEILQALSTSSSDLQSKRHGGIRQIGRLLLLLQHFFEGIYKCHIPAPVSTSILAYKPGKPDDKPPVIPLRVTVFWKRESIRVNNTAIYVFKKGTVTVGSLRVRLAADLKVASPDLIRLVNSMRVTLDDRHDHMLIESIGITSFVDMTILNKPAPDTENFKLTAPAAILADDPESDQMAPRKLVADDSRNLSLLFELLSLPDTHSLENEKDDGVVEESCLSKHELYEISNYSWELLALLPTNPELLQEVETLGGVLKLSPPLIAAPHDSKQVMHEDPSEAATEEREVDWPHVLSTDGLLRQHYKLKIVYDMIAPLLQPSLEGQITANSSADKASRWSETFIDKGGVDCLTQLVLQTEADEMFQGNLFKQCLSLRIELLTVFLKQRPSLLASCKGDDSAVVLTKKLVHVLQSVILGPPDDDHTRDSEGVMFLDQGRDASFAEDERPVLRRIRSASQGSFDAQSSSSFSSPAAGCSVQMQKLERKRSREARFEKYFSTQTLNTSAGKARSSGVVPEERVVATEVSQEEDTEEVVFSQQDADSPLVNNIMELLKFLLKEKPSTVVSVFLEPKLQNMWEDALFVSLLQSPNAELREAMCAGVLALCEASGQGEIPTASAQNNRDNQSAPPLTKFFLTNLLILLPHSSLEMVYCPEFFKLVSKLLTFPNILSSEACLRSSTEHDEPESTPAVAVVPTFTEFSSQSSANSVACVDVRQLSATLATMLISHPPVEKSEEEDDRFLQGLMRVFVSFLSALSHVTTDSGTDGHATFCDSILYDLGISRHLILELFHNCLFSKELVPLDGDGSSELQTFMISNGAGFPKCKSSEGRERAFDLLTILSTESNNCALLLKLLRPHHSIRAGSCESAADVVVGGDSIRNVSCESKSLSKYRHAVTVPKSSSGYCGMLNPSCVCYLNSTLQQLFHVSSFRQGVLEATTENQLDSAGAKDDMLLQLQLLFATLQESHQAFADPKPFCYSFKDWDGRPTNVSVQQDASEFLAKFFQQVENAVMGSQSEKVLKNTFGGYLSNELLATAADGSSRRSERPEPFYVLSVPVGRGTGSGNNCLADALSSFIRGEQVDYTWETEVKTSIENNNNVDDKNRNGSTSATIVKEALPTTKRASIKQLPNHLIIHLKRFDFNFETMQQIKINDRFDFPHKLDMYPYTVLGREEQERAGTTSKAPESEVGATAIATCSGLLPEAEAEVEMGVEEKAREKANANANADLRREECQYELAGVVVHVGTAHSGHYYSLVKSRTRSSSTSPPDSWFELNDSFVSDFDVDDLESETFGGATVSKSTTAQVGSAAAINAAKDKLCAKNAFMLVYDRVNTTERDLNEPSSVIVPAPILTAIQRDNQAFWNTKTIFDPMYYNFLTNSILPGAVQVLESVNVNVNVSCVAATHDIKSMLELILSVMFGTFSQAQMQVHVQKWTLWLVDRMRRQPNLAYWLLQLLTCTTGSDNDKENWLCALLLDSEDQEIRLCGRRIISVALVIVSSDAQFSSHAPAESSTQSTLLLPNCEAGSNVVIPVLNEGEVLCLQVVDYLMRSRLRVAQVHWRRVNTFFTPVSVLANTSAACRAVMLRRDYLAALLSFFLCQDTPHPELVGGDEPANHKSRCMCEGNISADFSSLLVAVVALLRERTKSESEVFVESDGKKASFDSVSLCGADDVSGTLDGSSAEEPIVVSTLSLDMLKLPVFMYRLLKTLDNSDHKPQVQQIVQFVLKDSKELTEKWMQIILSAMKKEDGVGLKAPLRCAMLLCRVRDSVTGWRVSYVMQQVVMEIKANIQYVQAADLSITMFLRICKQSLPSAEWFRLNYSARLTWIEAYLLTRKAGQVPLKSFAWKPIKTIASSATGDKSVQGAAALAAAVKLQSDLNLQLLKRLLNKSKDSPVSAGNAVSAMIKFSRVGVQSGGYDSDDDPSDLIGLRVQVQWKSTFHPGRVISFDRRTRQHMVHYDDDDEVACDFKAKVWNLLE